MTDPAEDRDDALAVLESEGEPTIPWDEARRQAGLIDD